MNLEQEIKSIIEAKTPTNVSGTIVDFSKYNEVYSDGQWSDCGIKVFFNKETKALVLYTWSNWQGSSNTYRPYTLQEYRDMMPNDEEHFDRWVEGLRLMVL